MNTQEIVERIMSAHWEIVPCPCWICTEGRKIGCRPRRGYLQHIGDKERRYPVPWHDGFVPQDAPVEPTSEGAGE